MLTRRTLGTDSCTFSNKACFVLCWLNIPTHILTCFSEPTTSTIVGNPPHTVPHVQSPQVPACSASQHAPGQAFRDSRQSEEACSKANGFLSKYGWHGEKLGWHRTPGAQKAHMAAVLTHIFKLLAVTCLGKAHNLSTLTTCFLVGLFTEHHYRIPIASLTKES